MHFQVFVASKITFQKTLEKSLHIMKINIFKHRTRRTFFSGGKYVEESVYNAQLANYLQCRQMESGSQSFHELHVIT